jgi:hypothetical protein
MTPADERIVQLLAKWRKSLDLHSRYTKLSDDQYWLVQPWPQHQRPTPWIVDLARQRLTDLQRIVQARVSAGDPSLSEALELMGFLANLVGSQHVQRYIPMAEPEQQRPIESLVIQESEPVPAPTAPPPRSPAPPSARVPEPEPEPEPAPAAAPASAGSKGSEVDEVLRDAARLLSWGREWHELPAAIARIAGRPKTARVRQILKERRREIEAMAAQRNERH